MMSEYMQWYYHLIKPWEHYVPMRADAEDVELIYEWLINHPDECQRIVKNANQVISTLNYEQEVDGTATLISEILKYAQDK
jgi:spore maturation protein CgeB